MISTSEHTYWAFRKRLLFRLLLFTLAIAFIVKFGNLLLTHYIAGHSGFIDNVAGMSLMKFAPAVSWTQAFSLGGIASLSVIAAITGLSVVNRLKVRVVRLWVYRSGESQREFANYLILFVLTYVASLAGVIAAETLALLTFLPLLIYSLLSPAWENQYSKARLYLAVFLAFAGFSIAGSKTIILHLVVGLTINSLFTRRRWWPTVLVVLIFSIFYPYLIRYRSFARGMDVGDALYYTTIQFSREFSLSGPLTMFVEAYGAILNRIVGLDGLLVATIFQGQESLTSKEISFQLAGYEGIGISLSMFGRLYVQFQDIFLAAVLFPIIVVIFWRFIIIISSQMNVHGFSSFSTFLYIKAIFILIGGFRWTDIKLILATIIAILVVGWVSHVSSCSMVPRKRPRTC